MSAPLRLAFGWLFLALTTSACARILGAYTQRDPSASGQCTGATEDEDCLPGYGCEENHCALRCAGKGDTSCGADSRCADDGKCTVPIGTPCDPGEIGDCYPLHCETLDSKNQKVPGYCTDDYYNLDGGCPDTFPQSEAGNSDDCVKP
jgi:hypothetical protein